MIAIVVIVVILVFSRLNKLVFARWLRDVEAKKVSSHKISLVLFSAIPLGICVTILAIKYDYFNVDFGIIYYVVVSGIFLIGGIDVRISSSVEHDEALSWIRLLITLLTVTYLSVLVIEFPKTIFKDLVSLKFPRIFTEFLSLLFTLCGYYIRMYLPPLKNVFNKVS